MATDGERSLSSGMSFPQWMKNKMNNRLDLDQSTFSPPERDDTFLYIPYPRHVVSTNTSPHQEAKYTPITDLLERNRIAVDYTNHTKPCQQYINGNAALKPAQVKVIKSAGVDDGFKGEAAACGTSVVRVAHQMVVQRGFNVSSTNEEEPASPPVGWDASVRRGSKSLPSSPVSQRKHLPNKYFTGAFVDGTVEKYQGSWILSSFLGKREDLSKSITTLAEEETKREEEVLTEKKKAVSGQIFRAKASELREMNFWSPTTF